MSPASRYSSTAILGAVNGVLRGAPGTPPTKEPTEQVKFTSSLSS